MAGWTTPRRLVCVRVGGGFVWRCSRKRRGDGTRTREFKRTSIPWRRTGEAGENLSLMRSSTYFHNGGITLSSALRSICSWTHPVTGVWECGEALGSIERIRFERIPIAVTHFACVIGSDGFTVCLVMTRLQGTTGISSRRLLFPMVTIVGTLLIERMSALMFGCRQHHPHYP